LKKVKKKNQKRKKKSIMKMRHIIGVWKVVGMMIMEKQLRKKWKKKNRVKNMVKKNRAKKMMKKKQVRKRLKL